MRKAAAGSPQVPITHQIAWVCCFESYEAISLLLGLQALLLHG